MSVQLDSVMLVDDNKIDAILNKKVIEKEQFAKSITIFNSALIAIKELEEISKNGTGNVPSLIFVDMMMPDMNGFQFAEKFEQLPENITDKCKIVFMSGSLLSQDQKDKVNQNKHILKFVSKPINSDSLSSILENLK